MLSMRNRLMLVLAVLLVAMVAPVRAQDGLSPEELALLAEVQTSVTKFYEQQDYSIDGQQVSTNSMEMAGQNIETVTTLLITGQTVVGKDGIVVASYQSLETLSGVPGMPTDGVGGIRFAYETMLVDGQAYVRFSPDMTSGPLFGDFPEGWAAVPEDGSDSLMSAFALVPAYGSTYLPISGFDPAIVKAVTELEPDEIDGQAMRVIEIEIDSEMAQASALYGLNQTITSQVGGAALGGTMGGNTGGLPGTDTPVMPEQLSQILEGMTTVQRIWIGVDDQLPHRVEMTIHIETEIAMAQVGGMTIPFAVDTVTTLNFADFNSGITIEAPEIGS